MTELQFFWLSFIGCTIFIVVFMIHRKIFKIELLLFEIKMNYNKEFKEHFEKFVTEHMKNTSQRTKM